MEQKLFDAASKLPESNLSFEDIRSSAATPLPGKSRRPIASLAACVVLLICICFGLYACAEVEEYNNAVEFFDEHDLSTEGLTWGEIKAVYRDIITESFTHSKTAEVIERSLSDNCVSGYKILQEAPSPEDLESLWKNSQKSATQFPEGIYYKHRNEYKEDPALGFDVHDKSFIEKYDGETLVWSVPISDFTIDRYSIVSDGILIFGDTFKWSSKQVSYGCVAKIDTNGNLLWKQVFSDVTSYEHIRYVLENADGSYTVFGNCDVDYFCFRQISADGVELLTKKTEVGPYGVWNVARLGDGYLVQLGNSSTNEHAKIVKVDALGNITESFFYSEEDAYYFITDMIEFGGKVYLSAYAVPRLADESQDAGGRYDIAAVLNHLYDYNLLSISPEELTPLVRDNNTAMLLVCDPGSGEPEEFFSVEGSIGGNLSLGDSGTLLWDVESITYTYYSYGTSAYSIGGSCQVFRYSFNNTGVLVSQENTGETTPYYR